MGPVIVRFVDVKLCVNIRDKYGLRTLDNRVLGGYWHSQDRKIKRKMEKPTNGTHRKLYSAE